MNELGVFLDAMDSCIEKAKMQKKSPVLALVREFNFSKEQASKYYTAIRDDLG